MKNWYLLSVAILLFAACKNEKKEVPGKITERKTLPGNKLMISYSFLVDGQLHTDSVEINNKNLPSDSVIVEYTAENPKESNLRIP